MYALLTMINQAAPIALVALLSALTALAIAMAILPMDAKQASCQILRTVVRAAILALPGSRVRQVFALHRNERNL